MKLAIVDDEGIVHDVTDELEAYDLSKPMAKANLIQEIVDTLNRIASN